jgi:hypothetical protein
VKEREKERERERERERRKNTALVGMRPHRSTQKGKYYCTSSTLDVVVTLYICYRYAWLDWILGGVDIGYSTI